MRTPYAGGEGGSLAKILPERKRREVTQKKTRTIGQPAVLINTIS
jgi:hypothetical protein